VTERQEAGNAIQRRSEIVAVPLVGRAGVDRHPHAQPTDGREVGGLERPLRVEGRTGRGFGPGERRAERVADGPEHVPAVRRDGGPHEPVVKTHGLLHRRSVAIPPLRASFDVAEEKGHRPRRNRNLAGAPVPAHSLRVRWSRRIPFWRPVPATGCVGGSVLTSSSSANRWTRSTGARPSEVEPTFGDASTFRATSSEDLGRPVHPRLGPSDSSAALGRARRAANPTTRAPRCSASIA
jgi:hypothetical protein